MAFDVNNIMQMANTLLSTSLFIVSAVGFIGVIIFIVYAWKNELFVFKKWPATALVIDKTKSNDITLSGTRTIKSPSVSILDGDIYQTQFKSYSMLKAEPPPRNSIWRGFGSKVTIGMRLFHDGLIWMTVSKENGVAKLVTQPISTVVMPHVRAQNIKFLERGTKTPWWKNPTNLLLITGIAVFGSLLIMILTMPSASARLEALNRIADAIRLRGGKLC